MGERLRVALVGCGGMGLRHLAAYAELASSRAVAVELAAICDPDPDRLELARVAFARQTGRSLEAFALLADAVEAGIGLEAADLALPTRLHHTAALEAFELGLHVLVEKPIALTVRAARMMVEGAERASRTLAVSENFRRIPANRAVRALIRDGAIGSPYWTTSELVVPQSRVHPTGEGEWYRDRLMSGSLIALEMGVHEADLLNYLFGSIERVSATVRTYESEVPGSDGRMISVSSEDTCFARFELSGGTLANVTLTMAGHGTERGGRLAIGREGSLSSRSWEAWQDGDLVRDDGTSVPVGDLVRAYVDRLDPATREQLLPQGTFRVDDLTVDPADPLCYGVATAIVDFARATRNGERPEVGADEALEALGAALAVLESSVADRPVAVQDVLSGAVNAWQAALDRDLGMPRSESKGV